MISGTLCGRPRHRSDLDDEYSYGIALLLSLMSTVASLPFLLFTLPAGALADGVDRRVMVCPINICMAAAAFALAVLGWTHLLNPYLILGLRVLHRSRVCHQRTGLGIDRAPGCFRRGTALGSDYSSASPGLSGPVLGDLLVLLAGAHFAFALNAACFLLVVVATRQRKQPTRAGKASVGELLRIFRDNSSLRS